MTQSNTDNSSFLPLALAGCVIVGGLVFAVAAGMGVVVMAGAGVAAGVFSSREAAVAAYEQQIAMDEARLAAEAEQRMGMDEARRAAEAAAVEAAPTSRVTSSGEGTVVLISGDRRYPLPADVPVGTYSFEASFPDVPQAIVGSMKVQAGQDAMLHCVAAFRLCREK